MALGEMSQVAFTDYGCRASLVSNLQSFDKVQQKVDWMLRNISRFGPWYLKKGGLKSHYK